VAQGLKDAGIRFVFGIPGTHNLEVYDAMLDEPDLQAILVTDEQSAGFMADGVARSTGGLAAINLVPGAGLTHALSGIAECYLDQIPMLVLLCGIRKDLSYRFQLHDIPQTKIVSPVCKQVVHVDRFENVYTLIRYAADLAMQAPRGPVVVEIPAEHYLHAGACSGFDPAPTLALPPQESAWSAIIHTLNRSSRIGLYVGSGVSEAGSDLARLADTLDAVVFTTLSGKGSFPESHPRWVWPGMGNALPSPLRPIERELDCLLAIGCRFGEVATASYGFHPPQTLIHVDVDSSVLGANYPAKVKLTWDGSDFVKRLVNDPALIQRSPASGRQEKIKAAHEKIHQEMNDRISQKPTGVHPGRLFKKMQDQWGSQAIFVTDSGNGTFLAMENLRLNSPRKFLAPVDYSCMGYAVPAAIGAKLASPDLPVIALPGDGAFLMTGLEILTARRYGLALAVMILNDGSLSQIQQFQSKALGRTTCDRLMTLDFEALAKFAGIPYMVISSDLDIEIGLKSVHEQLNAGQGVLVDVRVNYQIPTYFTQGVVKTNFLRLEWKDQLRMISRVIQRKIFRNPRVDHRSLVAEETGRMGDET
jgi:acetolactate synthase-1/2/3 large subunit